MFKKSLFILATACMLVLSACTDSAQGLAVFKVLSATPVATSANSDLLITTNATKLDNDNLLNKKIRVNISGGIDNFVTNCNVDGVTITCKLSGQISNQKYIVYIGNLRGYVSDLKAYQEVPYSTEFTTSN